MYDEFLNDAAGPLARGVTDEGGAAPGSGGHRGPRQPLVGLAASFILGTVCGLAYPLRVEWVWGAACAAFLGAAALAWAAARSRRPLRRAALAIHVCVFLTGGLAALVHPADGSAADVAPQGPGSARMEAVGVVTGDPDAPLPDASGLRVWKVPMRTESLRRDGQLQDGQGRVTLLWIAPRGSRPPAYGQRWAVSGRARIQPGKGLRRGRVFLSVPPGQRRLLTHGTGGWFAACCYRARQAAAQHLAIGIGDFPREVGVLQSLVLGYRERLSDDLEEAFAATGTLHIFAISGSHVVIVCGLLVFVLRALRISRILWVFFLAPLLAAYTVATGCEPSATRACIMAVAYFTAPCLGRRTDVLSALALAALIILAWSPAQVCAAGFLCSFVVVGGLVVLCPLLERPLRPLWSPDPLRAQPERWAARLLRAGGRGTAGLLALNAAAWLSSAPLTAYFFGRFTPVALLSNFVVIPLAFAAVLAGCLAVVLGACLAPAADLFNHANLLLARVLMAAAERLLRLPGGSIAVGPPPAWAVLGCYGLLAVWPLWAAAKRVDSQPPE